MGGLDEATGVISPAWIQAGELGLAFVIVILAVWLVVYVMRKNDEREKRYIQIINEFTPLFQDIRGQLLGIKDDLKEALGRKKPRDEGLFHRAD